MRLTCLLVWLNFQAHFVCHEFTGIMLILKDTVVHISSRTHLVSVFLSEASAIKENKIIYFIILNEYSTGN